MTRHQAINTLSVGTVEGGFAVLAAEGRVKIGPNPLTRSGAEHVLKILVILGLDYSFPQPPTARAHNSKIVTDPKLQAWLQGQV